MAQQSASDIAEQAIAKLDAEEAGIDTSPNKEEKKQDDKGQDAKSPDEKSDKGSGKDSKVAGKSDAKTAGEKSGKDDEAGGADSDVKKEGKYTADDALEVDEAPKQPQAPTDNAGVHLSADEQKYIVEHIGEPLIIRGMRGTGDNAKEVEIKAFSINDIPQDFHFTSDQQRLAAQTGFVRLEQKAEQLLGSYRQNQSQSAAQDYDRRENEGIKADVADLQSEGRFPKFTVRPGAKGFDDSPEAQQMAEVLKIMTDKNEMYIKQYNQGRPYKHIGFSEAFDLWEAQNPQKQAAKAQDAAQAKEDSQREKVADKVGSGRGLTQSRIAKPRVTSGMTIDDILNRHETDEW